MCDKVVCDTVVCGRVVSKELCFHQMSCAWCAVGGLD